MPRKPIDYSKTHFYKIVCKDLSIKDCYVGHTTDFKRRKSEHKKFCKAERDKHYNLQIYKFIRETGGWENWEMILLQTENCENGMEARRKERYYKEQENATLNKNVPSRTFDEYLEENKERFKEYRQNYYAENIDTIKQKHKEYRRNHKEEKKLLDKEYRENNKETIRENKQQWYENNKDKVKQRVKENREKKRHERSQRHQDYLQTLI